MAGFYLAFTNMPLAAVKIKFSIFSELLIMLLHGCNTGLYRVKVALVWVAGRQGRPLTPSTRFIDSIL